MQRHLLLIPALALLLAGCGHKNPLLAEDMIAKIKSARMNAEFFQGTNNDWDNCGNYYAGYTKSTDELEESCKKWSANSFAQGEKSGDLPYQATIEDFRDSKLWQIVLGPKKDNG